MITLRQGRTLGKMSGSESAVDEIPLDGGTFFCEFAALPHARHPAFVIHARPSPFLESGHSGITA